ncbi:MAG: 30S ribosomal protein S12 methylthiotransferase RimO [Proteobacteria bacterium]|nr:30S ribosomal protein S12 methylthiotransferase RimO [Pseudomonadota bacterium]
MKNVHFVSLGCARNLVDSEVMAGLLAKEGYKISGAPEEAELIVVNTCGFIDQAKQESIDHILEAAQYKNPDKGKCEHLVVTGCLSERYPQELHDSIPEIDLITGSAGFSHIVEKVDGLKSKTLPTISVDDTRLKDYELPRINSQAFYTAYLKLAEGCAKRCSFCIIPKLRGNLRSRSVDSLIKEAHQLVEGGVKEINLIAQDLTDYGRDRNDGASLATLLKELVKIEKLKWIRLFYTYPDQLDDEVISLIKNESKICKYLDVPVQHIHDVILKRMNRHTSGSQISSMIQKLKKEIPEIIIRTSLMVGFPGESDEHFEALKEFVELGLLDQVGVFTYSHEEGTGAFMLKDDVPAAVKEKRKKIIHDTQLKIQKKRLKNFVGKKLSVLVEGPHEETPLLLKGRHFGQAPEIDTCTLINGGQANIGDFVEVEIESVVGMDLCGPIV